MLNSSKWEEKIFDKRKSYPLDRTFIRTIFSFRGLALRERVRIVQYNKSFAPGIFDDPLLIYSKMIGSSSNKATNQLFKRGFNPTKILYKILSKIFNKTDQTYHIKNSNYMVKYPFIKTCFKDIIRDEKLEQLLK